MSSNILKDNHRVISRDKIKQHFLQIMYLLTCVNIMRDSKTALYNNVYYFLIIEVAKVSGIMILSARFLNESLASCELLYLFPQYNKMCSITLTWRM